MGSLRNVFIVEGGSSAQDMITVRLTAEEWETIAQILHYAQSDEETQGHRGYATQMFNALTRQLPNFKGYSPPNE